MDRSVLMQSLSSRNLPVRYAALKAMKNAVIGCKTRKSEFLNLGAVERLVYWRFLLVLLMTSYTDWSKFYPILTNRRRFWFSPPSSWVAWVMVDIYEKLGFMVLRSLFRYCGRSSKTRHLQRCGRTYECFATPGRSCC